MESRNESGKNPGTRRYRDILENDSRQVKYDTLTAFNHDKNNSCFNSDDSTYEGSDDLYVDGCFYANVSHELPSNGSEKRPLINSSQVEEGKAFCDAYDFLRKIRLIPFLLKPRKSRKFKKIPARCYINGKVIDIIAVKIDPIAISRNSSLKTKVVFNINESERGICTAEKNKLKFLYGDMEKGINLWHPQKLFKKVLSDISTSSSIKTVETSGNTLLSNENFRKFTEDEMPRCKNHPSNFQASISKGCIPEAMEKNKNTKNLEAFVAPNNPPYGSKAVPEVNEVKIITQDIPNHLGVFDTLKRTRHNTAMRRSLETMDQRVLRELCTHDINEKSQATEHQMNRGWYQTPNYSASSSEKIAVETQEKQTSEDYIRETFHYRKNFVQNLHHFSPSIPEFEKEYGHLLKDIPIKRFNEYSSSHMIALKTCDPGKAKNCFSLMLQGYNIRLGETGRKLLKKEISRRFRYDIGLKEKCATSVCHLKNANVFQLFQIAEITGCLKMGLEISSTYWKEYAKKQKLPQEHHMKKFLLPARSCYNEFEEINDTRMLDEIVPNHMHQKHISKADGKIKSSEEGFEVWGNQLTSSMPLNSEQLIMDNYDKPKNILKKNIMGKARNFFLNDTFGQARSKSGLLISGTYLIEGHTNPLKEMYSDPNLACWNAYEVETKIFPNENSMENIWLSDGNQAENNEWDYTRFSGNNSDISTFPSYKNGVHEPNMHTILEENYTTFPLSFSSVQDNFVSRTVEIPSRLMTSFSQRLLTNTMNAGVPGSECYSHTYLTI